MSLYEGRETVVYHTTQRVKAKTILKEGFNPYIGMGSTSELIRDAVSSSTHEWSLPFDRSEVTYFHLHSDLVEDMVSESQFTSDTVAMVVDFECLVANNECYVGDMDVLSDVIDMSVGASGLEFDSIGEAVRAYEDSVFQVESVSDVAEFDGGYPELLVVGRISADCVLSVVES